MMQRQEIVVVRNQVPPFGEAVCQQPAVGHANRTRLVGGRHADSETSYRASDGVGQVLVQLEADVPHALAESLQELPRQPAVVKQAYGWGTACMAVQLLEVP